MGDGGEDRQTGTAIQTDIADTQINYHRVPFSENTIQGTRINRYM